MMTSDQMHEEGYPPYFNPYGEEQPCPECGGDPCECPEEEPSDPEK